MLVSQIFKTTEFNFDVRKVTTTGTQGPACTATIQQSDSAGRRR